MADPGKERRLTATRYALLEIFAAAGAAKLLRVSMVVAMFDAFGLPRAALVVVAVVELGLAALLAFRRTQAWGAMSACVLMAGAAGCHVITGVMPGMVFVDGALFLGALTVVVNHRPRFMYQHPTGA